VLPCPDCDEPVEVTFEQTGAVRESDHTLPLDDAKVGLE
jgi:hypothetical protein